MMSLEDINNAIRIANEAGHRGYFVKMAYIPPQNAIEITGNFVVSEWIPSALETGYSNITISQ